MADPCTKEDAIDEIKDGIKEILHTLNGNGEGGLKTRVAVHRVYFKLIAYIGGPVLTFVLARAVWGLLGK
jgi:hypothetical protein